MFGVLRQLASLQEEDETTGDGTMYSTDHYLYFRGIPNPPDDYQAPIGASPNTWPQIYKNLQNMDYCTTTFNHLGNRLKCMKAFNPGPMLP